MNNNNSKDLPKINKEELDKKLALVDRANTASVLMAQLCKEMGLDPKATTHQNFVMTFSNLQKDALEAQKDVQDIYISAKTVKLPTKRARKAKKGEEEAEVVK